MQEVFEIFQDYTFTCTKNMGIEPHYFYEFVRDNKKVYIAHYNESNEYACAFFIDDSPIKTMLLKNNLSILNIVKQKLNEGKRFILHSRLYS